MEYLLVLILIVVLLVIAAGGAVWFWLGVLVTALLVGRRAYRVRCPACGKKVIAGWHMRFCNQCGAEQPAGRGLRLRCCACGKMARSELNLNHCNLCGAGVSVP